MNKLILLIKSISAVRSNKYYRAFINFMLKNNALVIGDSWYIKNTDHSSLKLVYITDVTKNTVCIKINTYTSGQRFKISDIEFVEKADINL